MAGNRHHKSFKPLHFGADLSTVAGSIPVPPAGDGFKPLHFGADLSTGYCQWPAAGDELFQTPSFRGGSKHNLSCPSAAPSGGSFKPLHFGADLSTTDHLDREGPTAMFQTPSFRGGSKHDM